MAKRTNNKKAVVQGTATEGAKSNVVALTAKAGSGGGDLKKAIAAYITKVKTLTTTELHNLANRCIQHFHDHGDTEPMLQLVNGLPKSLRRLELARWFAELSPVKWGKRDPKTDLFMGATKDKGDNAKPFDLETAKAIPFYDAPEQVKPKGLVDVVKMLTQQNASYKKMLEDKSIPRKGNISDDEITAAIKDNESTLAFLSKRKRA